MRASATHDAARDVAPSDTRSELQKILLSKAFQRSPQLQRFLSFLVEETLGGHGDRLKEYVLGTEVFGRPASYDPRLDSLVRVEAHRLRGMLKNYYRQDGVKDAVLIELSKGSYPPTFRYRAPTVTAPSTDQPSRQRNWKWLTLVPLVLIALIVGAVYWFQRLQHSVPASAITVAVLPFQNASSDPDTDYVCFGLMDEITTELAKLNNLRVVARTSAEHFSRSADITTIGRQLKANAIVEGSVSRSSDHVRITVQLINAEDAIHLWSETYERSTTDLLRVQNDVALAVADAIAIRLSRGSREQMGHTRYSADPEANQLYWRGAFFRAPIGRKNWRADLAKSAGYLEQAVQRDPQFAVASAALADVYVSLAWERGGGPITADYMTRGRQAATRALQLDSSLAEAYSALGIVQFFYDYDRVPAERSFQRALRLDPNSGKVHMWYAIALVMQGRGQEAIPHARQARELDPLSYVANTQLAAVTYFAHHNDEALELVRQTLEVADIAPAHGLRGMILEDQGDFAEAIKEYESGLRLVPTHSYIKGMLGHAYGKLGRIEEAKALLKEVNIGFEQGGLSDLKASYIYLALGDHDRAFQHLERDYEQRDPELPYINVDPVFDPVREDPRFIAILVKLGLR